MTTDVAERLDAALRDEQPDSALYDTVRSLLIEGHTRGELVGMMQAYRASLPDDREDDDEILLDIMALLDGWASQAAIREFLPPPCKVSHRLG